MLHDSAIKWWSEPRCRLHSKSVAWDGPSTRSFKYKEKDISASLIDIIPTYIFSSQSFIQLSALLRRWIAVRLRGAPGRVSFKLSPISYSRSTAGAVDGGQDLVSEWLKRRRRVWQQPAIIKTVQETLKAMHGRCKMCELVDAAFLLLSFSRFSMLLHYLYLHSLLSQNYFSSLTKTLELFIRKNASVTSVMSRK